MQITVWDGCIVCEGILRWFSQHHGGKRVLEVLKTGTVRSSIWFQSDICVVVSLQLH
jgi:hypothetical protein